MEYNSHFEKLREFESGGCIYKHKDVDESGVDYWENLIIATDKAELGHTVHMLPVLHAKDPRRRTILSGAKLNKNPDLRIDGILFEVEHPTKPKKLNNLNHRISAGANQADYLIIFLDESIEINQMRRSSKSNFIYHPGLKRIEFKYKETYIVFKREDFIYNKKEPLQVKGLEH